jgi:hypothetical protein
VKVAGAQEFPTSADVGSQPFTTREVSLPPGYVVEAGDVPHVRAVVDNFREAILNPSTLDRLSHTILACWITGSFPVVAVSAWWLLGAGTWTRRGPRSKSASPSPRSPACFR